MGGEESRSGRVYASQWFLRFKVFDEGELNQKKLFTRMDEGYFTYLVTSRYIIYRSNNLPKTIKNIKQCHKSISLIKMPLQSML